MSDVTPPPTAGDTAGPGMVPCPACGKQTRGRYCSHCGAQIEPAACSQCDALLQPGDKYCFECGAPVLPPEARAPDVAPAPAASAAAKARRAAPVDVDDDDAGDEDDAPPAGAGSSRLPWIIGAVAVIAVIGIATWRSMQEDRFAAQAGQAAEVVGMGAPAGPMAGGANAAGNPLSMEPTQMADALYDRVMRLSAEGKKDSVAFFVNNVVDQVYGMIGPLDLDQHYDFGNVLHAGGKEDAALAHADTILAKDPVHLLGLALKFRAEQAKGAATAARASAEKLLASEKAEMAKAEQKPEYTRHSSDIELAVQEAKKLLGR
jgi:hypothetical protein